MTYNFTKNILIGQRHTEKNKKLKQILLVSAAVLEKNGQNFLLHVLHTASNAYCSSTF